MSEINLDIAYPVDPLIKQYVDYYYILNAKKASLKNSYTAYPNINHPVIFFEHTEVVINGDHHHLQFNAAAPAFCGVLNRFTKPLYVTLTGKIRTINIIFKEVGLNAFAAAAYSNIGECPFQPFHAWDVDESFISHLFSLEQQELVKSLDVMLVKRYVPFVNEQLFKSIGLLKDVGARYELKEIEQILRISRKTLFRLFKRYTGVSPTAFRRIMRFRQGLEKNKARHLSLTQLAQTGDFADQSHFIKELRKLTGDKPNDFIKNTGYVPGSKLLIKQQP